MPAGPADRVVLLPNASSWPRRPRPPRPRPAAAASRWLWCRPGRRCRAYPRWPCTTSRHFGDDVIAMAEAAAATRWAEVIHCPAGGADHGRSVPAGRRPGLVDGEVVEIGSDGAFGGRRDYSIGCSPAAANWSRSWSAAAEADAGRRSSSGTSPRPPSVEVRCFDVCQPHYPVADRGRVGAPYRAERPVVEAVGGRTAKALERRSTCDRRRPAARTTHGATPSVAS